MPPPPPLAAARIKAFHTRHPPGEELCAHRHPDAYAALVLGGDYVETGADGAWHCPEGVLVVHPPYHQHVNRMGREGARVLNLVLPAGLTGAIDRNHYGVFRVADPGRVESYSRRDPLAAIHEASRAEAFPGARLRDAWMDRASERLGRTTAASPVAAVAREHGISPEYFSRQFHRRFGIAPITVRREHRLRRALLLLARSPKELCEVAVESGYADQPHMTRELRKLTGRSPGELRRQLSVDRASVPG